MRGRGKGQSIGPPNAQFCFEIMICYHRTGIVQKLVSPNEIEEWGCETSQVVSHNYPKEIFYLYVISLYCDIVWLPGWYHWWICKLMKLISPAIAEVSWVVFVNKSKRIALLLLALWLLWFSWVIFVHKSKSIALLFSLLLVHGCACLHHLIVSYISEFYF